MPEQLLIDQCSPTLAGLKTGNMFPVSIEPGQDICKRKVVGSNPARNANLEGGDRKNRFPLLLSHKTISV